MFTLLRKSKCFLLFIFVLIYVCFIQKAASNHLANISTYLNETDTKEFCEKSECITAIVTEESDSNNASFGSQFFEKISKSNISNQCKDSLVIYFNEVINLKPWALEMLDASGKVPSSFFSVTMFDFGSLDDCIKIKADFSNGDRIFKGKYCLVHLRHPLFQTPHHNPYIGKSYTEAFGEPPEWIRHAIEDYLPLRFGYYGGICIPSTCTDEDLNNVISTLVEPLDIDASLSDCQTDEPVRMSVLAKLIMIFFMILLLLYVSGTILDLTDCKMEESELKLQGESLIRKFLKAFSIYTNVKQIFTVNAKKTSMDYLHGIRAALCLIILYGHSMAFPTEWKEMRFKNFHFVYEFVGTVIENNGMFIVDCFFTISGFLLAFSIWKKLEQTKGHLNVVEIIVQKYCKFTISQFFIVMLYIVLPSLSSGPVWNSTWDHELENCYNAGWKNLLHIQNYNPPLMVDICMMQTWFVANMMQLMIISLFLMIVAYRYPKAGILLGLILFVVPIIYYCHLSVELQLPFVSFNFVRYTHYVCEIASKLYLYSSYHLPSYLIGIPCAWICLKYGEKKLSKMWIIIGWISCILCVLGTAYAIYIPTKDLRLIGIYNTTRNSVISFATCWILYVCSTGQGGVVEKILSSKSLVPLSRISFSIFIVNPLYVILREASSTERYYMDKISNMWEIVPFFVFSLFFGFIVCILLEEPFNKVLDLLTKGNKSSKTPKTANCT